MTETSQRTLLLLSLLQARQDWTGPELSRRLGVDPRTVRRDVERLRELGYRVAATRGRDGGYRLDAGAELPPLLFDDEQVVALTVALQTAVSGAGQEIEEAAARALTTVRQVLPARLRHRVDAVDVTPVPRDPERRAPQLDLDVLLDVSAAVRRREVLLFDYAAVATSSASGPAEPAVAGQGTSLAPPRRVEPHHVVASDRRWYLVAWDLDRADWRTFRLDRMSPRVPTGPRFAPRDLPGGDVRAFVAARFAGSAHPGSGDPAAGSTGPDALPSDGSAAWPCRGWVELAAPAAAVAPFVEDGVVEDLGEGRCRLELGSWSWVALAARVAAFDADVVTAGPRELVEACDVVAGRLAAVAGPLSPRARRP